MAKDYKIEFNREQIIEKLNKYVDIIEDFDYHYEENWHDDMDSDRIHYFIGLVREIKQLCWELELEKL